MKAKHEIASIPEVKPGDDAKMTKIVDEVDRFFKSVHADIEDWKFSMEDYGDGTRIFVRFQIHFDQSVVTANPKASKGKGPIRAEVTGRKNALSLEGGRPTPAEPENAAASHDPDQAGAARRADLDLASFVDVWRSKRESSLHGEYHKKGAPYADARPEKKGNSRSKDTSAPVGTGEGTDDEPKVLDTGT
jgi:hypothetical protein